MAISSLCSKPHIPIQSISLLSQKNQTELREWGAVVPKAVEGLVHGLLEQQAERRPTAPAICSWDGNLSYSELNDLASDLASHLCELGVGPEVAVPLCFEESMWMVVAMAAVLKAGGVCVPMVPGQPIARQEAVLRDMDAKILLASSVQAQSFRDIVSSIVTVDFSLTRDLPRRGRFKEASLTPSSAAFIMFTSGSTGRPKGIIQEHGHLCTSTQHHTEVMRVDKDSRVLQFAAYNFDVSVSDIFGTFMHGGCVCIPSDGERLSDLAGAISRTAANQACLTPTVAKQLNPTDVSGLKTLTLGGEKLNRELAEAWKGHVHLLNIYGVTECTVWCAIQPTVTARAPENFGRGVGAVLWVVEPDNHNRLSPVGAVGELVIEGPILARGYLNDPQKTAACFVDAPVWLREIRGAGNAGRLYRTGDLVRQDWDGTLLYLRRKDTQVKLRGQRVELEEIEYHIFNYLGHSTEVVVEVSVPAEEGDDGAILAAILSDKADEGSHKQQLDKKKGYFGVAINLKSGLKALEAYLAENLPGHMVPSAFLSVSQMPMTPSGKTDRKMLRERLSELSMAEIREQCIKEKRTQAQLAGVEKVLATAWSKTLHVTVDSLSSDDNFFRIGGDSIKAIKLVDAAKESGIAVTVAQVISNPILRDMAEAAGEHAEDLNTVLPPFSLLPNDAMELITGEATKQCRVQRNDIEDVYPCTPLQEGLMALSMKQPGAYETQDVYELPEGLDMERFRLAWLSTTEMNAILRTRIIQLGALGSFQVVLRNHFEWHEWSSLEDCLQVQRKTALQSGDALSKFSIVSGAENQAKRFFVWAAHHAIYGLSQQLLLEHCEHAYRQQVCPNPARLRKTDGHRPSGFNKFIHYLTRLDDAASKRFWVDYFQGFAPNNFPALPSVSYKPTANATLQHQVLLTNKAHLTVTLPTAIHLAWAMVIGQHSGTDDVVIGATLSGRNAPVDGVLNMTGPTITTVPLRVQLDRSQEIEDALEQLQRQSSEIIPFEQTGLQTINRLSPSAEAASGFQNLVIIQPSTDDAKLEIFPQALVQGDYLAALNVYALMLECTIIGTGVAVTANFDANLVPGKQMNRIVHQFDQVLQTLWRKTSGMTLGSVEILSPADRWEIKTWNAELPRTVDSCVHELVETEGQKHPQKLTIDSWDGTLTYAELNELSSKLAHYLQNVGVGPEEFLPLCFEKSMWAVVAMMGVMKAGAAFLMLHPEHPKARSEEVMKCAGAKMVLASAEQATKSEQDRRLVIIVGPNAAWLTTPPQKELARRATPCNAAFAIFTSGSTGTPKGIVLEHQAYCTSALAHGASERLGHESRVLQFAAYTFDVSLSDILTTLVFGGCVCIPSDKDRVNDLGKVIRDMAVTDVFLTPSVSRVIKPSEVPNLKILKLGGEELRQEDIDTWAPEVYLINSYGLAECAVRSAYHAPVQIKDHPANIGRSVGGVCWIADAEDYKRLAPIGAVGELLLEGAVLARGYMGDAKKTATSFIDAPRWLQTFGRVQQHRPQRLFKTGDLVRYDADGDIIFVGRKDTQVKIRGQRVELGEVEHHLRASLTNGTGPTEAVAEIVVPAGEGNNSLLCAFIRLHEVEELLVNECPGIGGREQEEILGFASAQFLALIPQLVTRLRETLPPYMVPSLVIPLRRIPLTLSGKTDRRKLRKRMSRLSMTDLRVYTELPSNGQRQPLISPEEKIVAQLWADVLHIAEGEIRSDDSFLSSRWGLHSGYEPRSCGTNEGHIVECGIHISTSSSG